MGEWGVTVLEATGEVDGGDVWGTRTFRTREVGKSSLYRHEVRRAAVEAVVEALANVADDGFSPTPLDYADPSVGGRSRPAMSQVDRAIDWSSDGRHDPAKGPRGRGGTRGPRPDR
jgi:putative two-component system protein, hydrogenase maturation factor HypX/HoxX